MMSLALPIGEGASSLYLIPALGYTAHGARTSLDTRLSASPAVLLSMLPAGPGMGCFFVYKGWY